MVELTKQSNSAGQVGIASKINYNLRLFAMRLKGGNEGAALADGVLDEIAGIVSEFEIRTGRKAAESTVVEIGYGARPARLFAFSGFFGRVVGMDLDSPVLRLSDIAAVFRRNGFERGLKSLVRHALFDARSWKRFHARLRAAAPRYDPASVTILVGDAGGDAVWRDVPPADLVFSSDVFEHIPPGSLPAMLRSLAQRLAPGGIVITRPMVFTGIAGGHDLEWYPHRVDTNASASAWGHLLNPTFQTNTYLNKLRRADFAALFREHGFRIVRDHAMLGRLGERHLSPQRRSELAAFDDYELFSNRVEFVLEKA